MNTALIMFQTFLQQKEKREWPASGLDENLAYHSSQLVEHDTQGKHWPILVTSALTREEKNNFSFLQHFTVPLSCFRFPSFFFLMDGSTSCIVALENFSPASSFAIDFLLKHPVPSMFHVGLLSAYVPLLHFLTPLTLCLLHAKAGLHAAWKWLKVS